jgi:hypothetical protein
MSHATKPTKSPFTLFKAILVIVACHEGCALMGRCAWSSQLPTRLVAWTALLAVALAGLVRFRHRRAAMHSHHVPPLLSQKRQAHDDY